MRNKLENWLLYHFEFWNHKHGMSLFISASIFLDIPVGSPGNSVKNLPAIQETQVQSLSGEDPLEKGMATHSSILAWRIPWTEKPGRLQSIGLQRVGHAWAHVRSDTQFASSKHSLDEEFSFFNREYAIHIFYIVLSLCEGCIFQEISLFYLTYEIDWCKIISNSHLTFYFSFNPVVYLVKWLLSLLVLRVVSLIYFVIRVLFFEINIFKLTFLTPLVSSISSLV